MDAVITLIIIAGIFLLGVWLLSRRSGHREQAPDKSKLPTLVFKEWKRQDLKRVYIANLNNEEFGYWDQSSDSIVWTGLSGNHTIIEVACRQVLALPKNMRQYENQTKHSCADQPLVIYTRSSQFGASYYALCNGDLLLIQTQSGRLERLMSHRVLEAERAIEKVIASRKAHNQAQSTPAPVIPLEKPGNTHVPYDLAELKPGDSIRGMGDADSTWARGIEGEEKTAEYLDKFVLAHGGKAIHSIPLKRSDIDHLLILPQGVYAINTKTSQSSVSLSGGNIFVNGKPTFAPEREYDKSRRISQMLTTALNKRTPVTPIIIYHSELPLNRNPNNVVTDERAEVFASLSEFLTLLEKPRILSNAEVEKVWVAARKRDTWV